MKRFLQPCIIGVLALCMLIACGGGGGSDDRGSTFDEDDRGNPVDPTDPFEVDALARVLADTQTDCEAITCTSADAVSSLLQPGGELTRCTWHCVQGVFEGETRLFLIITDYLKRDPQSCFEESFFGLVERDTDCIPSL
jgi:hypothetical protein